MQITHQYSAETTSYCGNRRLLVSPSPSTRGDAIGGIMSRIAFLGLGAMGSRMAAQLLSADHALVVWNRSPEKTDALRAAGAEGAASPRAAAEGADFVLAMVRDDQASREIWLDRETGALASIRRDAVAIECSTLGLQWVAELSVRCKAGGVAFLDAPLAGSRPQAEQRQLIFFVGGDPEVFARAEPILKAMGAAIHHAGLNGAGALTKLVANALFGIQVA
ncbi:MAG TPA: NAD(P)-dependent oxidoreductase, partial [Candidatus Binatia bacterium]|nr:NAD(P)-dependent oxidoreductase [Candidatus Binatia bacterium]